MDELGPREMFERELRKLYHAELEILDLNADLARSARTDRVESIFADHTDDTTDQLRRIERIFEKLDIDAEPEASSVMEGIVAEKDIRTTVETSRELRDLEVLCIGVMNERFEITVLDQLLFLATALELDIEITNALEANRHEAQAALSEMQAVIDRMRT